MCVSLAPPLAHAQRITVDGRLSPAQTLVGPNYVIDPNLGRQVGGNLFHSFGQFGLTQAETATFSGPATVTNVIGRVTGGAASSIDGTIRSTIAGANLYLINPAGIVFGPNATVNVSGSFHASTADYLRMSDGAKFQATSPDGGTLSAAPPAAFGFLNATPGKITISGSTLEVPQERTLGVVGGPVTIDNDAIVSAPSGTVHVTSAAGAGEVPVDPANSSALTVADFGSVRIAGNANLVISNQANKGSGGNIFVRAGTLTIADGGILDASNFGTGPGGQISVYADSQIALSNGGRINSVAMAAGRGGDISLTTGPGGNITAATGALVKIGTAAFLGSLPTGGSGRLTISTGNLTLNSGAVFGSEVRGSGPTGPVSITAGSIVVDGRASGSAAAALTGIRSLTFGSADAADIAINTGALTILANGEIVSNTRGAGNAGRVSVAVADTLSIDATSALFSTGIGTVVSPNTTGNAGAMTINAASLSVIGNTSPLSPLSFAFDPAAPAPNPAPAPFAGLSAQTLGAGTGGTINLTVARDVTLSGAGPQITARSAGAGDAGAILVSALRLRMTDGAAISTEASAANGGNIGLAVSNFMYLVNSQITTSVHADRGNGGNIAIDAKLLVLDHSKIIAQAVLGHGGDITIAADEFLRSTDSLVSASSSLGISGTVEILGPRVDLNGSLVVLSSELRSAAAIFRDSCAARGNRPRSSLTEAGRGGLPQDPDAALLALHAADRDFAPGPRDAIRRHSGSSAALATLRAPLHCQ